MLSPEEIKEKAERKYPDFLKSLVTGDPKFFPLRIRFRQPSSTDSFIDLKNSTELLATANFGYVIEFEERNTRKYGRLRLPADVRFDTEEQFVNALGKTTEVTLFKRNIQMALQKFPSLHSWLVSYVRWVVEFGGDWDGILAVCEYFQANPRPQLYVRQLPIPVHTKFIQQHAEILRSMLMVILPENAKDAEGETFEDCFGLLPVHYTVRFRALDPAVAQKLQLTSPRMGLPLDCFRALMATGLTIVITENLMNLECLPSIPNGLGIFGQGGAATLLTQVGWLNDCAVLYWGDLDEHGFDILARLRSVYPKVRSVMMDAETLSDLCYLCGEGKKSGEVPSNLTQHERTALEVIKKDNLRLEQEKIPLAYSNSKLFQALAIPPT